MPQRLSFRGYAFDLPDPEAARDMAQKMADKCGREIVVSDEDGNEVCRVRPIRRNELIVLTKN